jgi:dTDP-glucose 4,6-dehydratase
MNTKVVYVTGCLGFIGYHVTQTCLNQGWYVIGVDKCTYASNVNFLSEFSQYQNFKFIQSDINDLDRLHDCDYIINMAAETHVDNSIMSSGVFLHSNVNGVHNLLELIKQQPRHKQPVLLHFSTDEVFGPAPYGINYKENDRYNSTNPYSASKAAAEEFVVAYENTYKLPAIITHTMNVFGERQHPEKYIPLCIKRVRDNQKISIHSNPEKTKAGSRHYIHAKDVADALLFLYKQDLSKLPADPGGAKCQKFNIVGSTEIDNLELAQYIADVQGKSLNYEMLDFHSQRPGHDLRYALDGSKMKEMGWVPQPVYQRLEESIHWTLKNDRWLVI